MAAVVATDEWPRRSLTVAMSTPFSSRRDAWLWRTVWSDAPFRRPGWKAVAAVRVLAARRLSRFSSGGFPGAKWAGNAGGTQITYIAYISRVGMVLDHENKRDRLRAGFDRQAGRPRCFAGSAGRKNPGNGQIGRASCRE